MEPSSGSPDLVATVKLTIPDTVGRVVRRLVNAVFSAGAAQEDS